LQIIDFASFIGKIAAFREGAATVWRPNVHNTAALRRNPFQTGAQTTACDALVLPSIVPALILPDRPGRMALHRSFRRRRKPLANCQPGLGGVSWHGFPNDFPRLFLTYPQFGAVHDI